MESPSPPWHVPRAVSSPSEALAASLFCKPQLVTFSLGGCVSPQITARESTMANCWPSPSGGSTLSTPDPIGGVGCQGRRCCQVWGHPLCLVRQGWRGAGVTCH